MSELQAERWLEPEQDLEREAGLTGRAGGVCLGLGELAACSVYEGVLG